MSRVPLTKSALLVSIISKKSSNVSGSTEMSASSMATTSPVTKDSDSQTAFAFPFLVCSKTLCLD